MKLNQRLRKSAAPACLISLFMCSMFGAQHAQAQDKVSDSPQGKAQASDRAAPAQDLQSLRRAWAKTMHHTPAPKGGCFHASYPSTQWQEVKCAPPNGWRSDLIRRINKKGGEIVGGAGGDIIAEAPSGLIFSNVEGSFPTVNGVTSETDSG